MQVLGSSDLEATYAALSRTEYTWEELQQRPLPPGVDPARIETYLSTSTFQVFKITPRSYTPCADDSRGFYYFLRETAGRMM